MTPEGASGPPCKNPWQEAGSLANRPRGGTVLAMTSRLGLLAGRLLLEVMLLTFLSPSFGWQVIAGHDLLEHGPVAVEEEHHPHARDGDHDDHDQPIPHGHDHEDAHSMIGHVLSHMPAVTVSAALPPPLPHQPVLQGGEPSLAIPTVHPDLPYRPPQLHRA